MASNEDIVAHLTDFASSHSLDEEVLEYIKDNDLVQYHTRKGDIVLTVTVPDVPAGTVLDWPDLARDFLNHLRTRDWYVSDDYGKAFPSIAPMTTFNTEIEME